MLPKITAITPYTVTPFDKRCPIYFFLFHVKPASLPVQRHDET
jgi:hypothetical protein